MHPLQPPVQPLAHPPQPLAQVLQPQPFAQELPQPLAHPPQLLHAFPHPLQPVQELPQHQSSYQPQERFWPQPEREMELYFVMQHTSVRRCIGVPLAKYAPPCDGCKEKDLPRKATGRCGRDQFRAADSFSMVTSSTERMAQRVTTMDMLSRPTVRVMVSSLMSAMVP